MLAARLFFNPLVIVTTKDLIGLQLVIDVGSTGVEIKFFYLKAVKEPRTVIDPKVFLPEQMVREWFADNQSSLVENINSRSYDVALCETLRPIKSMPHKLDVISAMVRLAVADGDYSDLAKDLINKTCLYWNKSSKSESVGSFGLKPSFQL